jgi:hypothetical protein
MSVTRTTASASRAASRKLPASMRGDITAWLPRSSSFRADSSEREPRDLVAGGDQGVVYFPARVPRHPGHQNVRASPPRSFHRRSELAMAAVAPAGCPNAGWV